MARWRLTQAHYLSVPGTEWEYKETDQATGRQGKKNFPVPLYLNPNSPADCNYPGEVIVTDKKSAEYPRDNLFVGPPTPDMEPIDAAAKAISESHRADWVHPIESLPSDSASVLATRVAALEAEAKPAAIARRA